MIVTKVYDSKKLNVNTYPELKKLKSWRYAFVKEGDKIVLCEISDPIGKGKFGYSYADIDIVNKKSFDKTVRSNKDFYNGSTWEEYRSWVVKDILIGE